MVWRMRRKMYVRLDCRNFRGDVPCSYNATCLACPKYQPQGTKILIIKLAAVGDVLRTTPILFGLKRRYPVSFITWITNPEAVDLLKRNDYIDRLLVYGLPDIERLKTERFDIIISLDKETAALGLVNQIEGRKKIGFGLDPKTGNVIPLNKESNYAWELGLSDELKFRKNKKTYQQIIFEMCGLEYKNDEYILNISDDDKEYASSILNKIGLGSKRGAIIGLNTGAGGRFANKSWTESGFVELIRLIRNNTNMDVILLGGQREALRNERIISQVRGLAYNAGCDHNITQFAALIDTCSLVVSADTTALHIAIALKRLTVSLFGPTCEQEIELYGRGVKVISPADCRPCYKMQCKKEVNCMDLIQPEDVFAAVQKVFAECER